MAVGEVYKAAINAHVSPNNPFVFTSHWRMISAVDPVNAIGSYLTTQLVDLWRPNAQSQFFFDLIQIRRLSVPQVGGDYTTGYPIQGGQAPFIVDLRTSLVCSLRTQFLGRSYRGRMYLGGFPYNQMGNGIWADPFVAAFQTIFDDIVAGTGVGGANPDIQFGVWSPHLGQIPPPPGHPITGYNLTAGFHQVTSVVVRTIGYTQRRRGAGIHIRD